MTELIPELFYDIGNIAGRTDEGRLTDMLTMWCHQIEMRVIREALAKWLGTSAKVDMLRAAARETSTHYVWPLAVSAIGYSIVVNEFKDPRRMVPGYATTIHDHRYSFVSLVLSGGYSQVRSAVEILGRDRAGRIREVGQETVTEGAIVAVNHAEFHRLTAIKGRTITLVVKCPAVKEESLSVDISTHRLIRHRPVESRIGNLVNALTSTKDQGR
jgi:hypothetical protein